VAFLEVHVVGHAKWPQCYLINAWQYTSSFVLREVWFLGELEERGFAGFVYSVLFAALCRVAWDVKLHY